MSDGAYSAQTVAMALADPDHHLHRGAQAIVRAYGKRRKRSAKQSPPAHFVWLRAGNGGIEACCVGWTFMGGKFTSEIVAEGLGPDRRQHARDGAWDVYEETWQAAHDALVAAGAIPA